jgi:uncharacterized membrane protein YphA (DoxX/SURF4 family)
MIDPVIELSVRAGLALLFGVAAWHKMSDRVRFGATLRAYRLLPSRSVSPIAWLLPLLETFVAIGLLFAPTRTAAAFAAISILVVYTLAIATNLARGRREIDCGCFASSAPTPLSGRLIARNAILIASAAAVLLPLRARTLTWIDVVTTVTALVTLSLLGAAMQRLAQTAPMLRRWGGIR